MLTQTEQKPQLNQNSNLMKCCWWRQRNKRILGEEARAFLDKKQGNKSPQLDTAPETDEPIPFLRFTYSGALKPTSVLRLYEIRPLGPRFLTVKRYEHRTPKHLILKLVRSSESRERKGTIRVTKTGLFNSHHVTVLNTKQTEHISALLREFHNGDEVHGVCSYLSTCMHLSITCSKLKHSGKIKTSCHLINLLCLLLFWYTQRHYAWISL
jgi:hypothetical protein